MALETPKTKSEIKGNIASLEGRIKNQEDLIKSYKKIINNLNTKITAFQRFINIEKLLKVESDPVKINKLKTEQATLVDKYSILTGKDQAAVEAEIVSIEREKKDRQKDLDKEIDVLDEDKLNLRDHKAIEDKRPWAWLSKSGVKKAVAIPAIAAGSIFFGFKAVEHYMPNLFGKDSDKNKTEKTTPKVDTTVKKGPEDTTYVMPAPASSKKDTVYAPEKSKEKELENLRKKNKDLADRLKNVEQKKKDPEFDYFKDNFEGFIGIGKDLPGDQILYKGKVLVFDNVKHAAEAQVKLGISPKRNSVEKKSDFNPKSLSSYNENGRYKVKFNGEIYSYDNIDDAGKVQRAEKERIQ